MIDCEYYKGWNTGQLGLGRLSIGFGFPRGGGQPINIGGIQMLWGT